LQAVFFIAVVIICEVLYQRYLKQEVPFKDISEVMTREEFDSRVKGGDRLCLLDDMVLDMSSFRNDHPGGRFLIDFHIGRDVSEFFYGGYVLENQSGMSPHTHSNVARSIVNRLAIAKLTAPSETFQGVVKSKHDVNKTTKVFTL